MDIGVVSLCSTKNVMLEGGPLPWIVDTSGYYEEGQRSQRILFWLNDMNEEVVDSMLYHSK